MLHGGPGQNRTVDTLIFRGYLLEHGWPLPTLHVASGVLRSVFGPLGSLATSLATYEGVGDSQRYISDAKGKPDHQRTADGHVDLV